MIIRSQYELARRDMQPPRRSGTVSQTRGRDRDVDVGTLPRAFDRACSYHAEKTALVDGDRRITYRRMAAWANQVGNGLASLGVGRGDRVGMLLPNCLEFIPTQHGIWKSGAAAVQMPARASADDQRFFLTESGASALIYHEQFDDTVSKLRANLPQMTALIRVGDTSPRQGTLDYTALFGTQPATAPDVAIDENDLAFIAFTSGTTGTPKGVLQSHAIWSHYLVTAGLEIADTRACEVSPTGDPAA
jgi:acyl-CoA synthetase (AMP-forming)/AMP-acid ligase II